VSLCVRVQNFFGLPAQRAPTPSNEDSQGQGSQMEGGSSKDVARGAARLWTRATTLTQQQVWVCVCAGVVCVCVLKMVAVAAVL
jgi:hypothetical protein